MNNEIKEILEYISDRVIEKEKWNKVKDYITNLQEEYEKEHYLVDKLTRQLTDEYKNTEYQCKQKEDYKSRNEKAVEYIEKQYELIKNSDKRWQPVLDNKKLLNILRGDE